MSRGDAVLLRDFFPDVADVTLRKGMASHLTAVQDSAVDVQVETLVSYRPPTGGHKLWAFAGTKAFDATTAGAAPAATLTGLTNARWQTSNFTTSGGNFLLCVNGADNMRIYDGTSWTTITGVSTPAITGVNTNTLIHVNVHKARVWYTQAGTLDAWYAGVGAFAGAVTKFSLGSIFRKGGFLMAMGTWTIDGGNGVDDLAVFITSQGEVAVYQGSDPSSASTWALVGIFNIGEPVGRRCLQKYGGDLLMITKDGVVPASKALINSRVSNRIALTDRISGAMANAVKLYGANFGWEVTQYPGGNMLVLNVPVAAGLQKQYVMNTTTGAWCEFSHWYANCFEIHNGDLYFGTLGAVRKAWTGTSDLGANIVGEAIGAFEFPNGRAGSAQVNLIQPVIGWDSNLSEFLIGVDSDYVVNTPTGAISFPSGVGSLWDAGLWDSAVWGGDIVLNKQWYTVFGNGYSFAPHLKVSTKSATVRWSATTYLYLPGSVLS